MKFNFLLYENFSITTALPVEEVVSRLQGNVQPESNTLLFWRRNRGIKPYQGFVLRNSFRISRVLNHRNSFKPFLTGTIESQPPRTMIRVKMRMHDAVYVILVIWLIPFTTTFAGIVFKQIVEGKFFSPVFVIGFMILFAYTLVNRFTVEGGMAKSFLVELVEGEEKIG